MIAVLGSINMDLVLRVARFPAPGETLAGSGVATYLGGKGANQAVAAARLGADVQLYGKVGDDAFSDRLIDGLQSSLVRAEAVGREHDCASGMASIWVNDHGENAIVLAAGANGRVDTSYVDAQIESIAAADTLLVQLEIPMPTIAHALRRLPAGRPTVILDPAPASDLSSLPLNRIDILTPNEHELRLVSGTRNTQQGAFRLLDQGVSHVICTLGEQGAVWFSSDGAIAHFSAPKVRAVDTTAAGDAFNGALAWALQVHPLEEAIAIAVQAGAFATTTPGAQASLPTLNDIRSLGT